MSHTIVLGFSDRLQSTCTRVPVLGSDSGRLDMNAFVVYLPQEYYEVF